MNPTGPVPYCGAAPLPADLATAWNFDPVVVAVLLAATGFCLSREAIPGQPTRRRALLAAAMLLAIAFLSPLCALASALFSARVVHHLLLISLAAPLLALAWPAGARGTGLPLTLTALAHVAAVWFWHAPGPYAAAMGSHVLYWLMQGSLLGTGVLVWRELLAPGATLRAALGHVVLISAMGLLGALITFAPVPLYAPHFLTADLYGLSPLEDQQLAGLVMWVPAILPNLVAALACLLRLADGGTAREIGSGA